MIKPVSFEKVRDASKGVYRMRVSSMVFFVHFLTTSQSDMQTDKQVKDHDQKTALENQNHYLPISLTRHCWLPILASLFTPSEVMA